MKVNKGILYWKIKAGVTEQAYIFCYTSIFGFKLGENDQQLENLFRQFVYLAGTNQKHR